MSSDQSSQFWIAHHTLRITEPHSSLWFYQQNLGMTLLAHRTSVHAEGTEEHYFLGFSSSVDDRDLWGQSSTCLELIYQPGKVAKAHENLSNRREGYWKIGITLEDVDLARQSLIDKGISVSSAKQFLNIGYLCHLNDPDGYCIELLQHRFAQNHQPQTPQMQYPLRSLPRLGQITLRVKDPEASLKFYVENLGMRLLSKQVVAPYRFTLYFLAYTNEEPPHKNLEDVNNREWLWQRPYTLLELQHVWGTEQGEFAYRVEEDTGFCRISVAFREIVNVTNKLTNAGIKIKTPIQWDTLLQTKTMTVLDPDGYSVRFIEVS